MPISSLAEKLAQLEDAIAAACRKASRSRGEVELMAVSKTYPAFTIVEAATLGLSLFGENRVQEFASKASELAALHRFVAHSDREFAPSVGQGLSRDNSGAQTAGALEATKKLNSEVGGGFNPRISRVNSTWASAPEVRFHLIGHLQSNKAARAAELFDAVDSVDSIRLAERLNEAAAKLGKRLPILIEVKLSPEESKAGLDPKSREAAELLDCLPNLQHLRPQGLMTIAPWGVAEDVTRACFRSLRTWRDKWAATYSSLSFEILSMGMSGDFPLAIEEGATRIRVGTALFGKRQPYTGPE